MKQKKCKNCKGKGYAPVYFMEASRARGIEDCPVCKGTGKIETEPREKQIAELEERIKNQAESLSVTLLEEEKKAERIKELEKEVDEVKLKSGYSTYLEDKIQIDELELKIKNLTKHLEPQAMTEIFKQVEEEVKQEQRIKNMKNCLKKWLKYENERDYELNVDELLTETMQLLEEKE